jgi:hypothetical protein
MAESLQLYPQFVNEECSKGEWFYLIIKIWVPPLPGDYPKFSLEWDYSIEINHLQENQW